jgi:Mlc titration factor MtfA (ptsG expression regulator)
VSLTDDLRARAIQLFEFLAPRDRAREALRSTPLAQPLRDLLTQRSIHYRRLPPDVRAEFDRQIQVFMTEKTVTPVKARVTGEIRLLTAASAVTLTAGWPGYTWDRLSEVLIYPKDYDEEYRFVEANRANGRDGLARPFHRAGEAHAWGVVILSKPSLIHSFARTEPAYHVGLHEFAHLLDLADSRFDGIPSHLSFERFNEWAAILAREDERLQAGDSILDPYGLSHPAELFAVAVEAFFQTPEAVAAAHAELYGFLAEYFNQDPAAWANASAAEM